MINDTQYINLCELDLMFTKENFQKFLDINDNALHGYNNQHWFTSIGGFAAQYNIAGLTYNDKHLKFPVFILKFPVFIDDHNGDLICHDALNHVFGEGFDDAFYYNPKNRDSFDDAKHRLQLTIAHHRTIKHVAMEKSIHFDILDYYKDTVKENPEKDCCTQDSCDPVNTCCDNETVVDHDEVKYINPVKNIYDIAIDPTLVRSNNVLASYEDAVNEIETMLETAKMVNSPFVIFQIEEHERDLISMLRLRSDFHFAGYDAYLNYVENRMIIRLI